MRVSEDVQGANVQPLFFPKPDQGQQKVHRKGFSRLAGWDVKQATGWDGCASILCMIGNVSGLGRGDVSLYDW